MSEPDQPIDYGIVDVDVRTWVDAARADPTQHRDRQVTEIVLAAIGLAPNLKDTLILKGGAAMALAFKSIRQTGDIDFTSTIEPHGLAESIAAELDPLFIRAAIQLGHLDLICRVQTIKNAPQTAQL